MGEPSKTREQLLQEWRDQRALRAVENVYSNGVSSAPVVKRSTVGSAGRGLAVKLQGDVSECAVQAPAAEAARPTPSPSNSHDDNMWVDASEGACRAETSAPPAEGEASESGLGRHNEASERPPLAENRPPSAASSHPRHSSPSAASSKGLGRGAAALSSQAPPSTHPPLSAPSTHPPVPTPSTHPPLPAPSTQPPLRPFNPASVDGIALRLASLKRESLRPPMGLSFEPASSAATPADALRRLAASLFEEDGAFAAALSHALTAQLTRSREGGTEATKIEELAGMVRSLRRVLRDAQARTARFVDAALVSERDAAAALEAVRLSCESSGSAAALELAQARRAAAAAEADHKAAAACWQGRLDAAEAAGARARREAERLEVERSEARELLERAAGQREALEEEREALGRAARGAEERVAGLVRERDALGAEKEALQGEREKLRAEKEALGEELARSGRDRAGEAERAAQDRRAAEARLERLRAELSARAEEHESAWRQERAAGRELEAQLEAVRLDKARLVQDAAAALAELEAGQERVRALERQGLEARQEAEGATARARSAEVRAARQEADLGALEAEAEAARAREREKRAELQEAREKEQKLERRLRETSDERTAAAGELEAARRELGALRTAQDASLARLEALEKERAAVAEELEKERTGAIEALERERAGAAEALERERAGAAEALEKERAGAAEALEKERAGAAEALEKERAGAAEALEKERSAAADARSSAEISAARAGELDSEVQRARSAEAEARSALERLETQLEALQEVTMGLGSGDQAQALSRLLERVSAAEAAAVAAEAARREAHNQLVDLRGNVRVFCRLRPGQPSSARALADGTTVVLAADGKEHPFSFDRVFKPEVSQGEVFAHVADLVQSALDGYQVCLFSYGQTGAGKTHTMQGGSSPEAQGIIPRAVQRILQCARKAEPAGWEYRVEASYIEIYNESLRDLLAEPSRAPNAGRLPDANAIQHGGRGGHSTVAGASRCVVATEEEAAALVRRAASARAVETTAMNASSSRSHSVFMLYITGEHAATGVLLHGSLNLVDLAGSERLARSMVEGQRQKEACSINKSLSALGDVFAALSAKSAHVPYRNSKLTHLLQPCLGGTGKTLMFVNVSPEPDSAGETLCTLRFAAKVNACETASKGGAQRHVSSLSDQAAVGEGDARNVKRKLGSLLPRPRA